MSNKEPGFSMSDEEHAEATVGPGDAYDVEAKLRAQPLAGPEMVAQICARMPKGPGALRERGPLIRPRMVTFIFDGSSGAPGVFADEEGAYFDVEITLRSLSSAEELEALQNINGIGAAVPMEMTKRALYSIAGAPLKGEDQRSLMWEALGGAGRQLCLLAFQGIGGASGVDLGKYQRTFSVS